MRLFILFLLVLPIVGAGQSVPLHPVKFSFEIEGELESGALSKSSAAYHYTYIGDYNKAIEYYELGLEWGLDTMTSQDSLSFLKYFPVNAFDYLEERTKTEELVIISEAHQKPQHRVFTRKLLQSLWDNGFRYLGVETLTNNFLDTSRFLMDTSLNERGYPLYSPLTGMYIREPQMANMVREAMAIGFEVFAYEKTQKGAERDLQQARNIKRFIDAHGDGKVVIHCGWYHAVESSFPKRKSDHYMAYHLKQLLEIDPLTIYQDALTEKKIMQESPYYSLVDTDEVSILKNEKGEVFRGTFEPYPFDILVYHPPTQYRFNRPTWLRAIEENNWVKIKRQKFKRAKYPVVVKAYVNGEPENAAPLDIVELKHTKDKTKLVLPEGSFILITEDRVGESLELPM